MGTIYAEIVSELTNDNLIDIVTRIWYHLNKFKNERMVCLLRVSSIVTNN